MMMANMSHLTMIAAIDSRQKHMESLFEILCNMKDFVDVHIPYSVTSDSQQRSKAHKKRRVLINNDDEYDQRQ